jgi:hypothetical protein
VVGCPAVLAREPYWRQLCRHAAARGAYRGAGLPEITKLLRAEAAPASGGEPGDGAARPGGEGPGAGRAGRAALPDIIAEWAGAEGPAAASGAAAWGAAAPDGDDPAEGDAAAELAVAAAQIAELAYLGLGDADRVYYETLDEYYEAMAVGGAHGPASRGRERGHARRGPARLARCGRRWLVRIGAGWSGQHLTPHTRPAPHSSLAQLIRSPTLPLSCRPSSSSE